MRLLRDTRGNAMAIMAAALIPVAAFAGAAIDVGRDYTVKTRLQQACDAGVLAGRKSMTDNTLDTSATGQAQTFFKNNFPTGYFSATNVSFTPSLTSDFQVAGSATATVPVTLMQIMGQTSATITVTCQARYDVADADIMFVLDTTGSMACVTSDTLSNCNSYAVGNVHGDSASGYYVTEKTGATADLKSRIQNLREAVASFYTTLTTQADSSTHYRFGFVPYSGTVNVGGLLQRSWLATSSWNYQTRWFLRDDNNGQAPTATNFSNISKADCDAKASHTTYSENATAWNSQTAAGYTATNTTTQWTKNSGNGVGSSNGTCAVTAQPVKAVFRYGQKALDLTSYAAGNTVANPSSITGDTDKWNGCIEERDTTASSSFSATSPPADLDVDSAPSSEGTRWRPMWPDAEFAGSGIATNQPNYTDTSAYRTPLSRFHYGTALGNYEIADEFNEVPCPRSAQRLKTMSLSDITSYLTAANGFRPYGVTYHDVGMTWGTRLLSPSGMFAADTAAWPGHNAPNRYIVFLTDGMMEPDAYAYASHGIEQLDQRVRGNTTADLTAYHNARFSTACQIAKNKGITIFLIAYAQSITSLSTEMQNCASPGQAYTATDTTKLNDAFKKIAAQVAMLRLSK